MVQHGHVFKIPLVFSECSCGIYTLFYAICPNNLKQNYRWLFWRYSEIVTIYQNSVINGARQNLKGRIPDKPSNSNTNGFCKTNRRYQLWTISILFPNQIFIVARLTGSITLHGRWRVIPFNLSPRIFVFLAMRCRLHDY